MRLPTVTRSIGLARPLLWSMVMNNTLAIVPSDSTALVTPGFVTIDSLALDDVNGGYDFSAAVKAGNTAAGPGREAGQTLGQGFDAGYSAFTGKDSKVGSSVGGPIGAAVGWAGGFATNTYQQLHGTKR